MRSRFQSLVLGLVLGAWVLSAGLGADMSLAELQGSTQMKLDQALAELAEVSEAIEAERLPLAGHLRELEEQVLAGRNELARLQRSNDNQLVDLGVVRKKVEHAREVGQFMSALLAEYASRFETRIHITEVDQYQPVVAEVRRVAANADLSPEERVAGQMVLLQASMDRLAAVAGGHAFEGKALTSGGRLEKGRYLLVGPTAYFASEESQAAGIAELRVGSPRPRAMELGDASEAMIRQFITTGSGELPIDASAGNALKVAATEDSFWQQVIKGGPVMIPILALGCAALVICLIKWLQISRIRTARPMDLQFILSSLRRGQKDKALESAFSLKGPVGEMLATAIEHAREKKEYIEEVMYEKMLDTRPKLEALMPIIALTAASAPLLGLLGTVTGMINTFNMITVFGAGDPRTLSGGISEALITTKFGLVVAIPALLMHAFISRKVKGVMGSMEQTTVGFINGVPDSEEERSKYA